ncbi:MAG: replicative DNA helicase [Eubacteriales bacterium]
MNPDTFQLPHNTKGEQAVLGSMLIEAACVPLVIEQIGTKDFYLQENRDMFAAICSMFTLSKPIDPVTIGQEMASLGTFTSNTVGYMEQLMNTTPTAENVMEYVKILKNQTLLRDIAVITTEVTALVAEGTYEGAELLALAEQRVFSLRDGRSAQGLVHISKVLLDVHDNLTALAESTDSIPGLSTGLAQLDHAISGLKKTELILLAARPGMGKTSLALNLLLHAGKHSNQSVAFFSLEMSRDQLAMRLIAAEALIDSKKLVTGRLTEADWEGVISASDTLQRTQILIDDNASVTVAEIQAKCRLVDNLALVVIDYLQLMQSAGNRGTRGENRQQVVSEISRSLKLMAKDLQVPVLCLSQLSRRVEERTSKRPMLSDLRESGAIEQDADIVMFLSREQSEEGEEEENLESYPVECTIAKNRQGETGTFNLNWIPKYTVFTSFDHRHGG